MTQITYPSKRQVSYALDVADRVQTVWNLTGGGNYASLIAYTPAGGLSSMTMGNGVTQQSTWDSRICCCTTAGTQTDPCCWGTA